MARWPAKPCSRQEEDPVTAQLALLCDPLADDLAAAEVAGVEARVDHDDRERSRHAEPAPACPCPRPWPAHDNLLGWSCMKCGRRVG